MTKQCKKCFKQKDESEFGVRFDGLLLNFCKGCTVSYFAEKRKKSYSKEVEVMRRKARQLRKLTDTQVVEIQAKRRAGVTEVALAAEYGVSQQVVNKVGRFGYAQG